MMTLCYLPRATWDLNYVIALKLLEMNELIKSDYKKKLLKKFKIKVPYGNNIIPNDYNMQ